MLKLMRRYLRKREDFFARIDMEKAAQKSVDARLRAVEISYRNRIRRGN